VRNSPGRGSKVDPEGGTPPPLQSPGVPSRDSDAPLAGVSSAIITAATRRVARRWSDEAAASGTPPTGRDHDVVAGLLAALALALDQQRPGYVSQLLPRPAAGLGHQLVEMLQTELLRAWSESPVPAQPSAILGTLNALEQVRQGINRNESRQFEAHLNGVQGLELLVEVIHDLRSPLTSILFLAETLQRGQSGEINPVQHRQLGLIYSAALGLSSVVSDAVELARGGEELADREVTPFSIAELFESVQGIVRPLAEEKGLALKFRGPDVDRRLGHPVALSRVLLNLTTNSIKFTEQGFVEIACEQRPNDRAVFSVQDTGPGVNPEALSSLFQPFRRAPGRAGYCFSGTGLGLAICRKLVEAQGSTLRLETRPGWGTRFFFELELPAHTPALVPSPPPSPATARVH
jgi:signal transduction histidine kinase